MISVEQAWRILSANLFSPRVIRTPLTDSAEHFLAEDIHSEYDHPLFSNSAVDGYAFRFSDLQLSDTFGIQEKIPAGSSGSQLRTQSASRIFTGAPLPPGADSVVMQEYVIAENAGIRIKDAGLKQGSNVRNKGEQIRAGAVAAQKGKKITPPMTGFLASVGVHTVSVFQFPQVHILVTGSEFIEAGGAPAEGKIFESNGEMLQAAFASAGIRASVQIVTDDPAEISRCIQHANHADLLVLTGGVSVGEFDFSRGALIENEYEILFHKVSQKPGKPLLMARKENRFAFGLPGNPRAGMMAFYLYILPWIHRSFFHAEPGLRKILLPISGEYKKKGERAEFITCQILSGKVKLGEKQDSHMLLSFADAAGIVYIPADKTFVEDGEIVEVFILPA